MLSKYFAFGLQMLGKILPLAQLVLMFVPGGQLPAAAMKILEKLPDIIALAERIFGDGTGEQKKAFAIETAKALANTIGGASTGGQAETWGKVEAAIGPAIDHIVGVINTYQDFEVSEAEAKLAAIGP